MSSFLGKIKNRMNIIIKDLKRDIVNFPVNITFVNFLKNITFFGGPVKKVNCWCNKKREEQIFDFLYNNNKNIFDKYTEKNNDCAETESRYIWVCWLQGEDNAPDIVKKCIDSIRKNASDYELVIINENNYNKYVTIPEVIIQKFQDRKISPAHFSDILRMFLLEKYGGLWLDATIYCSNKIPENLFSYPFFTGKGPIVKGGYVSEYRWTGFFLGGKKDCILYKFLHDFYINYWSNNDVAIDYLFLDYVLVLARKHIPAICELIDNVPLNNLMRDELQNNFNNPFNKKKYEEITMGDTYLHKLSWRMEFNTHTQDGEQTFFDFFLNEL